MSSAEVLLRRVPGGAEVTCLIPVRNHVTLLDSIENKLSCKSHSKLSSINSRVIAVVLMAMGRKKSSQLTVAFHQRRRLRGSTIILHFSESH